MTKDILETQPMVSASSKAEPNGQLQPIALPDC